MTTHTQITATCAICQPGTDIIISERIIGKFNDVDTASFAAFKERKENESVIIYNAPAQEEEELTALEMAEREIDWMDHLGEL